MKFLLDANISSETAEFLRRRFSFDVVALDEIRQDRLNDPDVINLAIQENRIIITQDLDFGELFHQTSLSFGVIILRLHNQRVPPVNATLEKFFNQTETSLIFEQNPNTLVVIDETSARIRK